MALELFYSALHWSKKAERFATSAINSARTAQTAAAQASQASGKIIQLGFDGAIEDGKLVFKHAPSGIEVPYELLDDYEYEVDMLYNSTEELSSDLPMVVKNGANTITFVSALHRSADEPATIGDMAPVSRKDNIGYRWLFKAAYKITPAGKKVFLLYPVVAAKDYSDKTNCITEIPQDIKLELNDGTLTLKAGSKVYVPNGFEADGTTQKFDTLTITSDRQVSFSSAGTFIVSVKSDGSSLVVSVPAKTNSGTTDPQSGVTYRTWYDTTNNIIHRYNANADTSEYTCSFPVCVTTVANGQISSIDQVFNGVGYIGSTIWVNKGVKCLIPNGRNEDGSLRNIEYIFPRCTAYYASPINIDGEYQWYVNDYGSTYSELVSNLRFVKTKADMPTPTVNAYLRVYVEDENNWYYTNNGEPYFKNNMACLAFYHADANNKVTSFTPKQPFRAVDYSDLQNGASFKTVVETYENGTEWYRIWSDGWIEQGGIITPAAASTIYTANFIVPFKDANSVKSMNIQSRLYSTATQANDIINPISGSQFNYITGNPAMVNNPMYWSACGFIE